MSFIDFLLEKIFGLLGIDASGGFVFAGGFLDLVTRRFLLYISGELGTGKTLLAFAIAEWLLENKKVRGVWANCRHAFPVHRDVRDVVFVLDEGGQFMHARDSKDEDMGYAVFMRKLNAYMLVPSRSMIDKQNRTLEAYRIADLSLFGFWLYGYRDQSTGVHGWFVLKNPEYYFPLYDTKEIPASDDEMSEALNVLRPVKTKVERRLKVVRVEDSKWYDRVRDVVG